LRKGEKLFEELLTDSEVCLPSTNSKIKIAIKEILSDSIINDLDQFIQNAEQYLNGTSDFVSKLKILVPEYQPTNK
jgi:FlaA1/EpsC-like NDP-sugar epimerase